MKGVEVHDCPSTRPRAFHRNGNVLKETEIIDATKSQTAKIILKTFFGFNDVAIPTSR